MRFWFEKLFDQNSIKTENLIFIPPEAHEGKEIDLKTDIYSYSMIVYWLFTGNVKIFQGTQFSWKTV